MSTPTLSTLFARWEEAYEQGRDLSPEELCAGHPDLLEPLRQGVEALRRMRQLASDSWATLPGRPATPLAEGPTGPPGYEVLRELGRGGMGVVYLARQVAADRLVALKM